MVALQLSPRAMAQVSVDLDDEPMVRPVGVGEPAVEEDVALRDGQVVGLAEPEQQALQLAPGVGQLRLVDPGRGADRGAPGDAASGQLLQRGQVQHVPVVGVRQRQAQQVVRTGGGEVEQRLGDSRHRQSAVHDPREVAAGMDDHGAGRRDAARGADVDLVWRILQQLQPPHGGTVAEHRLGSGVEHGGGQVGVG
jgi:hypothetical protein